MHSNLVCVPCMKIFKTIVGCLLAILPQVYLHNIYQHGIHYFNDISIDTLFNPLTRILFDVNGQFGAGIDVTDSFSLLTSIFLAGIQAAVGPNLFSAIYLLLPALLIYFSVFVASGSVTKALFISWFMTCSGAFLIYDSNVTVLLSISAFFSFMVLQNSNKFPIFRFFLIDAMNCYMQFTPIYLLLYLLTSINKIRKEKFELVYVILFLSYILLTVLLINLRSYSGLSYESSEMESKNIGMALSTALNFSNPSAAVLGFPLYSNFARATLSSKFGNGYTYIIGTIFFVGLVLSAQKASAYSKMLIFLALGSLVLSIGPFTELNVDLFLYNFFPGFHTFRSFQKFGIFYIALIGLYFTTIKFSYKYCLLVLLPISLYFVLSSHRQYKENWSAYQIPNSYHKIKNGSYFIVNQSGFNYSYNFRKFGYSSWINDSSPLLYINSNSDFYTTGASYSKNGYKELLNMASLYFYHENYKKLESVLRTSGIENILYDNNVYIDKAFISEQYVNNMPQPYIDIGDGLVIKDLNSVQNGKSCRFSTTTNPNDVTPESLAMISYIVDLSRNESCDIFDIDYKNNPISDSITQTTILSGMSLAKLPLSYNLHDFPATTPISFDVRFDGVQSYSVEYLNVFDRYNILYGKLKAFCYDETCTLFNHNIGNPFYNAESENHKVTFKKSDRVILKYSELYIYAYYLIVYAFAFVFMRVFHGFEKNNQYKNL